MLVLKMNVCTTGTMSCRITHHYVVVAILEAKSEGVEVEIVTTGTITVKLRSLHDRDVPKTTGPKTQISGPPDLLDHSGNHTHADNQHGEVKLIDGRNISHAAFTSYIPSSSSQQHDPDGLGAAGIEFLERFWQLGKLADLENAIANLQIAVEFVHDKHPDKPGLLNKLGISQEACFRHIGKLADL